MTWEELENAAKNCKSCGLCAERHNVVIGRGSKTPGKILFVGEGPGENEDRQGLPFVGQAGRLLDLALDAAGYSAEDYYIGNVVKCRPPQNREPLPEEISRCLPILRAQFVLLQPKIVVCLGAVAAKALINPEAKISAIRGTCTEKGGTKFFATYHPAALLRDESKKMDFYRDILEVKRIYESLG